MKQILTILLLSGLLISCGSEEGNDIPEFYELQTVKDFVPLDILESSSSVIFEGLGQDDIEFNLEYTERERDISANGIEFTTEEIQVSYTNIEEDFSMQILLTSQLDTTLNSITELLRISMDADINVPIIASDAGVFQVDGSIELRFNGQEQIMPFLLPQEIVINGTTFSNAYKSVASLIPGSSIQELYYNPESGIIGYSDEEGFKLSLKEFR